MTQLSNYFKKEFEASKPGEIFWSHAVNSQEKLERALRDNSIMFIESDIRRSSDGTPVASHPPETESDLTFKNLIEKMTDSPKGLKLDFKDPEIVAICLEDLQTTRLTQPVLLNADVLQGNGANTSKFNAEEFIAQCQELYPSGTLSLGWTTTANPELGYTQANVAEMLTLCEGIDQATFPVRACLLPTSIDALNQLTQKKGYTLSVWNNEPVSKELAQWIKDHTDPVKTFYDFIDDNKEPLRLW